MIQRILFICLLFIPFLSITQSVEKYSHARIYFDEGSQSELLKLGLELREGRLDKNHFIESDFSESELQLAKTHGFTVEIIHKNAVEYYKEQNLTASFKTSENCVLDVDFEVPENYQNGTMAGYFTYEEMLQAFDSMHIKYPNLIQPLTAIDTFKTHEGRPIYWTKLSGDVQATNDANKPEMLYTALHHAREPNSLSQMIYFLWHVLENYDSDPELKNLLDQTELFFIPCVNPDGYIYNQTTEPNGGGLWRKNRSVVPESPTGVDLNRNYGHEWAHDNSGSSNNPNSETYRGHAAFSEPETQAVKYLCETNKFELALNYHTYGNLFIYPWGFSDVLTEDSTQFLQFADFMTEENNYFHGTGTQTVGYVVNGDSDDWMYGEDSTKNKIISFTPEVGDNIYGFWPPESAIINLNQTCLLQNIRAAQLTLGLTTINELNNSAANSTEVPLTISNYKKDRDTIQILFSSLTTGIQVLNSADSMYAINDFSKDTITLSFSIDSSVFDFTTVQIEYTLIDVNRIDIDTVSVDFTATSCLKDFVFASDSTNINQWTTEGDWAQTNSTFYTAPNGFTDSDNGNYGRWQDSRLIFNEPIDLSEFEEATLSLWMKWDIESDYDFIQIQGSADQINYDPLCGLYARTRAVGIDNAKESIYDGNQPTWINERIDISDYTGGDFSLAFRFFSDGGVELDGMHIDQIEIFTCTDTFSLVNTINSEKLFQFYPNPVTDYLHIERQNNSIGAAQINILNAAGKVVSRTKVSDEKMLDIPLHNLNSGLYFIQYMDENIQETKRFIKL